MVVSVGLSSMPLPRVNLPSALPDHEPHRPERKINAEKFMEKIVFHFSLGAMLLALCLPAQAQQTKKVPRIGFLSGFSSSDNPDRIDAFRQGRARSATSRDRTSLLS